MTELDFLKLTAMNKVDNQEKFTKENIEFMLAHAYNVGFKQGREQVLKAYKLKEEE